MSLLVYGCWFFIFKNIVRVNISAIIMFSYLRGNKETAKKEKEEEKTEMKLKELKKQRNDTINLKEKVLSELMKPQTNVKENDKDMEDMEQLLKILELLDEKQSENERELDVHKRMFEMMIGGHGKIRFQKKTK